MQGFYTAADRLGVSRGDLQQALQFADALKDDMVADCSIASVYPPVVDITFVSGREIHAADCELRLIDGTEKTIYAEEVCPVIFLLGVILTWSGFLLLFLPLFTAGIEMLILTYIICS